MVRYLPTMSLLLLLLAFKYVPCVWTQNDSEDLMMPGFTLPNRQPVYSGLPNLAS